MHRIDTATAQKDKFGAGKNGFTRGNPQTGTPATDLDDDYFDMLQEELCGLVEAAGLVLDKGKHNQLLDSLFRIGAGAPPIGIPFFWPLAVMPNTVMDEWENMVFLKPNGASFSAETYPKLARVWTGLVIPDMRGEFPRIWDDGRGIDSGRALLSAQGDAIRNIVGTVNGVITNATSQEIVDNFVTGAFSGKIQSGATSITSAGYRYDAKFDVSTVVPTANENRSRNIALNFLIRAK
ncbi:phage tail protein [Citrobacter amalonaticus]|uniref:phage tail protein n=1 Tax=Citrobacter amalonaticus TaxID=35703 RepID=UPI00207D2546|nr:phage tail protein [Citrobacter amalonaticus]MCO4156912.1 phage tail protein [Citrobacter amalonaticus]